VSGGPLTLGTAGHIDHGKTALIGALTGVDTDRLPEEKERGISIALGFAPMWTAAGRRLSVVDVPGHERFVRTMVAGATGIDLFLMVVAADDGVMPQTIEHATVLESLGVRRGIVAITKADLADPEVAMAESSELIPGSEQVVCSARTGEGLEELTVAIERLIEQLPGRAGNETAPILHIDRSFTLRGQGTIVTGTLWSGTLAQGDTVELLPGGGPVRVRGLQVHDRPTARAEAGQRVAVNLSGVRVRDVSRGDVLAAPGSLVETTTLDCALDLRDAEHNQDVQVHHGTREVPGRLALLADDLWQLRLQRPVIAADGDRVVVRRASPPDTLGGGRILDAAARRHGRRADILDRLRRRRDGEPEPEPTGAPAAGEPEPAPPAADAEEMATLERRLLDAGMRPLSAAQLDAGPAALAELRSRGVVVRLGGGRLYMHAALLEQARGRAVAILERDGVMTLPGLRDELDTSRKAAEVLIEHFDLTRLTHRLPDDRRVPSDQLRRSLEQA
jgi:selenocysteine-specific elongation factor